MMRVLLNDTTNKLLTSSDPNTGRDNMLLVSMDSLNRAFKFSSRQECITIPHNDINNITIEFYIRTNSTASSIIFEKGSNDNNLHAKLIDGKIYFNTSSDIAYRAGTTNINDGEWHHIACVYSMSSNTLQAYTDLTLTANITNVPPITVNTSDWHFGSRLGAQTFDGDIAEIRFWDDALSVNVIACNATAVILGNELNLHTCFKPNSFSQTARAVKSVAIPNKAITTATLLNDVRVTIANIPVLFKKNLKLNGVNGYVTVPFISAYNIANSVTLSAWSLIDANPNAVGATLMANDVFSIVVTQTLTVRASITTINSTQVIIESASSLRKHQWNNITVTYDSNVMCLYVNGALAASTNATQQIKASTNSIKIGIANNIDTQTILNGSVAYVKIWNIAKSVSEVRQSMHAIEIPNPTLIGQWELTDTFGTLAKDSSSFKNDGTYNSAQWRPYTKANNVSRHIRINNGVGNYIIIPYNEKYVLTKNITVEFFIRLTSYPTAETFIISKHLNYNVGEFAISIINSTTGEFFYGVGDNKISMPWNPSMAIPLNTWVHLKFVKDTLTRKMRLYKNDNIFEVYDIPTGGQLSYGTIPDNPEANPQDLYINASSRTSSTPALELDEVRIWSIARDPSDEHTPFNHVVNDTIKELNYYFTFDDPYGNTAVDYSMHKQHGVINGQITYELNDNSNNLLYGPPVNRRR
jgi:hypothetical protein